MQGLTHVRARFTPIRLEGPRVVQRREILDRRVPDIAFLYECEFAVAEEEVEAYLGLLWDGPIGAPAAPDSMPMAWAARFQMGWGLPLRVWPHARCEVGRRSTGHGWWGQVVCEGGVDAASPEGAAAVGADIPGLAEVLAGQGGTFQLVQGLLAFEMDDDKRRMLECLYAKVGWMFALPIVNGATCGVLAIPNVVFVEDRQEAEPPPRGGAWWSRLAAALLGSGPRAEGGGRASAPPVTPFSAADDAHISLARALMTSPPPPPDTPEEAGRTAVVNGDIRRVWQVATICNAEMESAIWVQIDFRGTAWACRDVVDDVWRLKHKQSEEAYLRVPEVWHRCLRPLEVDVLDMPDYRCVVTPAPGAPGRWDVRIETGQRPLLLMPPECETRNERDERHEAFAMAGPQWESWLREHPDLPEAAYWVATADLLAWQVDDVGKAALEEVAWAGGYVFVQPRAWLRTHQVIGVRRLEDGTGARL